MRDREHDAPVEHRQSRDGEPGLDRVLVRPVAVQVQGPGRALTGFAERTLPHERDRHPRAVLCEGPVAPLRVILGGVATEHRLTLAQQELAGRDVVVVHGPRSDEGPVPEPHHGRRPLGIAAGPRGVEIFGEVQLGDRVVAVREDAETCEALAAVRHDRPVAERRHVQQAPAGLVGQHDGARTGRILSRDPHQLEIERAVVVQDVQHVLTAHDRVRRRVLDALAARPDRPRLGVQVGCRDEQLLGCDRRPHLDHEVGLAAREARADPVALVALVVQLHVGRGIRSHFVEPHGVGPPRVVDRRVDDVTTVGGEAGPRRRVLDDVVEIRTGREIAHAQRVPLVALGVDAVEQTRAVGRDVEAAE